MPELKPVTVTLSRDDLVRMEQIAMDKDRDEAMRFVQLLRERVEQQQKSRMKPGL
jgi:hypothetical protein